MFDGTHSSAPVMFNRWKHHKDYIVCQISECVSKEDGRQSLSEGLSIIGSSVTDLYFGALSPDEVIDEIIGFLKANDLISFEKYFSWLKEGQGYRLIFLSDTSYWTLRTGKDRDKYIHVHPGRYSPMTIRIKALTLKTIIATIYWSLKNDKAPTHEIINTARLELLQEPPLKYTDESGGLGKLLKFFMKNNI